MAPHTSPEAMWIKFFSDAGLPSGIGATYALTFTDNRIQMNMLLDLNKEYLREMGISCMGDVIAILRHAKQVHEETARDRVLGITGPKVPVAAVTGRPGQPKATTPATRILEHYTRNSPTSTVPASSISCVKERLGSINISGTKRKVLTQGDSRSSPEQSEERGITNTPKKLARQTISQHSVHDNKMVSGCKLPPPKKISSGVFSRLGSNDDAKPSKPTLSIATKVTVTGLKNAPKPLSNGNTVFARLGNKGTSISLRKDSTDSNEPLQYEGILKATPPSKMITRRLESEEIFKPTKKTGTMRADEEPVNVREKLPLSHQRKSVKFSPVIDYKEIEKRTTTNVVPHSPTKPVIRTVAISKVNAIIPKKVVKRTPVTLTKRNIKMRLGQTKLPSQTQLPSKSSNKFSVFDRLGITTRV